MVDFGSLIGKAKDFASKNPDKVKQGAAKLEQIVDEKTGGKYNSQIHQGVEKAEEQLGVPQDQQQPPVNPPAN